MTEAEYLRALDAIEQQMARDYLAEAARITRDTTLAEVLARIQAGNMLLARDVFNGRYGKLAEDIRAAYLAGGNAEAASLRRVEFDIQRASAQAWINQLQADAIQVIAREQGDVIQAVISHGQEIGIAPPRIARNLLGMMGSNGERTGGVVGLTGQDVQWLNNTRTQLASGDPSLMRDYFQRVRRDKRYDGIVERAIEAGRPVNTADIDKITQRYAERLLSTRADTVASIQALEAYNAGRNQLYRQLVEDGMDPAKITKRWKTRADEKVRASHRAMDGQTKPGDAPFVTPRGALMMNPGDSSMGAPMSEIARCRCRAVYSLAK